MASRSGVKKRRRKPYRPLLTIPQILAWADEHHRQHGSWPHPESGAIPGTKDETWSKVQFALYKGFRGLPGKTTLPRLLRHYRGVRCHRAALNEETIVKWARAEFVRLGRWPRGSDAGVYGVPEETWTAINSALRYGLRGLKPGSSLAKLLGKGRINKKRLFTTNEVLAWADAFFASHRDWPTYLSGSVNGAPGVTWCLINRALRLGIRGFKGKSSLLQFLNLHRGIFEGGTQRPYRVSGERRLTMQLVWKWARVHRRKTSAWPSLTSGLIPNSNGLTWRILDAALRGGYRGLPGGSSLAKLFGDRRKRQSR